VSSACARASAATIAPMRSLERCIGILHRKRTEADGARFGSLGAQAVADRLLGIVRNELFELRLGGLVIAVRRADPQISRGKLRRARNTDVGPTGSSGMRWWLQNEKPPEGGSS